MKRKSAGHLFVVGSGLGLAYGLAILLALDGVQLAAPVAAQPAPNGTLKTGRWVCYFPVSLKEGPDDPDRKGRSPCEVFYEGKQLKLKNQYEEVANATLVKEEGTWKVVVTNGWEDVNLKGIIKDDGKRIEWPEGVNKDKGIWVYKEKSDTAELILRADDLIVRRGAQVLVPIKLLNAKDVSNLDFMLGFLPEVVKPRPAAEKGSLVTQIWGNKLDRPDLFKFNVSQLSPIKGSGTVAGFRFEAIGPGRSRTPLTLGIHRVNNVNGVKLPIKIIDGSITIYDPGDLTDPNNPKSTPTPGVKTERPQPTCSGKGKQTVADAQCCLDIWVGLKPRQGHEQMDIDGDGFIDSRDAILILQNVAKELEK